METRTTERGFTWYGEKPITCTYGSEIEISQSSAAFAPHVWIRIQSGFDTGPSKGVSHLNLEQAKEVRDRLNAWINTHE